MTCIFRLRILIEDKKTGDIISEILELAPSFLSLNVWEYQVEVGDEDNYFDYVSYFANLVEKKMSTLKQKGIVESDVTVWFLYSYDNECNFEFSSDQLLSLGRNGIKLCVSCWKK